MGEKFTAYITKYALTTGIAVQLVEECGDGMVREIKDSWPQYYHGNEWHRTKEAAIKRAEEMRGKKLAAIEKQIKRIRALKFE